MTEPIRLTAADYDELLTLFNTVFGRNKPNGMDFERELPKMCVRDDEHMGKHFGVRENGRLVAALGVYPLPAKIGGVPVLFSTVGNVATHWDYEGRGCMRALMTHAMRELSDLGADASRLGGLRQRYSRWGYELCGAAYRFRLTPRNVSLCCGDMGDGIVFSPIARGDTDALSFAARLNDLCGISAVRSTDNGCFDVYASMTAWRNQPYLARNAENEPVGYLCVSPDGTSVAEAAGFNKTALLTAWQKHTGAAVSFVLQPWETDAVRYFSAVSEDCTAASPNNFKIINYQKITDALMKLKASYTPLVPGECLVGIEGYGVLRLYAGQDGAGAETVSAAPCVTLAPLDASRFLFGPLPPETVISLPREAAVLSAWLPLPLSWNLQDRV